MSKREETTALEDALHKYVKFNRFYGCEEVTIGFYNNGHGDEIVDFILMDSKGVVKCYEIKVTLDDLKSSAKLSWYGHYNYLVVTPKLYQKVSDWSVYIPTHVGVIVGTSLTSKRKAKRCVLSPEDESMLKESMVRSMFYKMQRYKDAQSITRQKYLESRIRQLTKECNQYRDELSSTNRYANEYLFYRSINKGVDLDMKELAKQEREEYQRRNPGC